MDDFDALANDVEARFEAIRRRNRGRMDCGEGCSDCCRCRLSVTRVEEAYVRRGLASLPLSVRRAIRDRATDETREMCPALDDDGSCQIYASRPLACRSFGAPLRYRYPVPLIHPSRIDVCDKNFKDVAVDTLPAEDFLDQTSLNDTLEAIDPDSCGERVSLATILADST